MGAMIRCGLTAVLFALLPDLGSCDCYLGGSYTDYYRLKNSTIWNHLNDTLMRLTSVHDQKIANFSEFRLWNYIQRGLSVTPNSYLFEGVCLGRLLAIDWQKATQFYKTNSTDNRTLEAYIRVEFIGPLHRSLQYLAAYYSFSLGIFRPRALQFDYLGVFPQQTVSYNGKFFDTNCTAGIRFLWRLSTSTEYDQKFEDKLGTYFARFANMIENSFDQYYRKHDTLGIDFVRVNVLDAHNASNRVIAFMEAYFINSSFTSEDITRLTVMHEVPAMYFSNGTTKPVLVSLRDDKYTFIVNATAAPLTTTTSTTIKTTVAESETQSAKESTIETTQNAGISSTTTAESKISPTTKSTTLTNTTTVGKNSEQGQSNSTVFAEVNKPVMTSIMTTAAPTRNTTTSNATRQITSQSETTVAALTSPVIESVTNSSAETTSTTAILPITNTSTTAIFVTSTSNSDFNKSSTLLQASTTAFQITSNAIASSQSSVTTSTPSVGGKEEHSTVALTSSNLTSQKSYTTTFGALYTSSNANRTGFSDQSTGSTNGNRSGTTFDPDPLFLASAPVIKKVYNDGVLLWKITPMLPITGKTAFFTITLPVALSIIIFATLCMVCWQVDCFPARRKT